VIKPKALSFELGTQIENDIDLTQQDQTKKRDENDKPYALVLGRLAA